MHSFVAQILYRVEDASYPADRYEVQCRLVLAADERQALTDARRLGLADEATLSDASSRLLRRSFVGIKDLRELALDHGARLFSELQELEPLAFPDRGETPRAARVYLS